MTYGRRFSLPCVVQKFQRSRFKVRLTQRRNFHISGILKRQNEWYYPKRRAIVREKKAQETLLA